MVEGSRNAQHDSAIGSSKRECENVRFHPGQDTQQTPKPMKIGLRELHSFLVGQLPDLILNHYSKFHILNESDLQFYVTRYVSKLLQKDKEKGRLELHGCLSCSDTRSGKKTFPDILVFHRGNPWVVIELKEGRRVKKLTAAEERAKIFHQRKSLNAKRGYLIYVGRWGKHRLLRGRKGPYGFWFYEVPIVLERVGVAKETIKQFEDEFRRRAKYSSKFS